MNVFVKIKGWYFCNRFRILLLPSEVLTSQEAFKFEKLCWKNTKQNMSSLFIEALYFLLECCWDYFRQYWGLTWPFRKAFIFSHIWDHCLSSLFAKFGNWKTACFQNEKCCFQGQILQEVEIRSWSNSVCRHELYPLDDFLTHPLDNHLLIKYKVLSYHGWYSGDSSTVTDYLYFLRNKNTYIFVSYAEFPNVANSAHLWRVTNAGIWDSN